MLSHGLFCVSAADAVTATGTEAGVLASSTPVDIDEAVVACERAGQRPAVRFADVAGYRLDSASMQFRLDRTVVFVEPGRGVGRRTESHQTDSGPKQTFFHVNLLYIERHADF